MAADPTRRDGGGGPAPAPRDGRQCPECGQRFSNDGAFCPFDGVKLVAATLPTADALLGATVDGRYEVLRLLGEGGMGQVFEVRHLALDRSFAMKVLKRDLARDTELSARFIDEAKATASIHHPNVVQITDFGRLASGAPYFVMELLVGKTLGDVIKAEGPLPALRAASLLRGIAGALGAAHAAGIVHRDLKPDNVFLVSGPRGEPEVRVVDFGAAKIVGSSRVTRQGIVFGTPHYMSPEQASGQPVDHRADIYAVGVIMYEMFTGRVPFEADTYMGVLTQHMFVQPPPPSVTYPPARALGALEDVTLRCLAKKPEERFATMAELSETLDRVVAPDGTVAPRGSVLPSRPPPPSRSRPPPSPTLGELRDAVAPPALPLRRIRGSWIAAGVALLAVLALTGVFASRDPAPTPASAPKPPPTPPAPAPAPTPSPAPSPAPTPTPTPAPAPTSPPPTAPRPSHPHPSPAAPALDDVGDPFAARH